MKKKVDFIHLGYNKTATTWWQTFGYLALKNITLLNSESDQGDETFYNLFVELLDYNFNLKKFQSDFLDKSLKIIIIKTKQLYVRKIYLIMPGQVLDLML